jgi:hypothetical protein
LNNSIFVPIFCDPIEITEAITAQ